MTAIWLKCRREVVADRKRPGLFRCFFPAIQSKIGGKIEILFGDGQVLFLKSPTGEFVMPES